MGNAQDTFHEDDSSVYDQEYYLNLEARYLSGAIKNRVSGNFAYVEDFNGKRALDGGCGGGFCVAEMINRGAKATGVGYAEAGVRFGRQRYNDIDLRVMSAYELDKWFEPASFDIVTLLDVIEHMSDHERLMANIRHVLKDGGRVVISTDAADCIWERQPWKRFYQAMTRFSADGRAKRFIDKIEMARPRRRQYNDAHINCISVDALADLLRRHGFEIVAHRIYSKISVPIWDLPLPLLSTRFRGEHECLIGRTCSTR